MDATAWTVIGATIVILGAIGTSFRNLRGEMRTELRDLRGRIDAQGKDLGEQIGQLRERMAHLEGLLEGLREAIVGKRVA